MPGPVPRFAGAFALLIASLAPIGHAQCPDWRPGSGLQGMALVSASTSWDPDGNGPQSPLLIAAGNFSHVDSYEGPPRTNIAAWDGSQWHDLGGGIASSISGWVNDLAVLNGELIAAGFFSAAGGTPANNIARWNGTAWQPLGAGCNGEVYALCLPTNGGLIAAGTFSSAGGVPAANIARWNNAVQMWSSLGAGVTGPVYALATLQSGDIIAGGGLTAAGGASVNRIARWNGSGWFNMNGGVLGDQNGSLISALHVRPNGDLIVGGQFIQAGAVPVNNIARWTIAAGGAWSALGSGVFLGSPTVQALKEFNGELIAGGRFIVAGDSTCNGVARWNGSTWSPLQQGIPQSIGNLVMTLAPHNGELFVGGTFPACNGSTVARSAARWTGTTWLTMPGFVVPRNQFHYAFATVGDALFIAGQHASLNTGLPGFSRNLVSWNGLSFGEVGNPSEAMTCLTAAPGAFGGTDLIAGGLFTAIGGLNANRIVRYSPQSGLFIAMGQGFNNPVFAVLHNPADGAIYAGGAFTASGGISASRIARWNQSLSQWQPLGLGLDGTVNCLKIFNGMLYAGGSFSSAGGVPTGGLARWNGLTWEQAGGIVGGTVTALDVFQSRLVIAGSIVGVNNSPGIMAFDGLAFSSLGAGGARLPNGTAATVSALAVYNNTLIAGGTFTSMGGTPADYIARWNGSSWTELGNGVQDEVRCLHVHNGELQVGGDFALVNNNSLLAPMWARFSDSGLPWPALQPAAQTVACNAAANFTTAAAPGYGAVTYQWRKNGLSLIDGPTGTGSSISGALTPALSISNVGGADIGAYDCVLSNACGQSPTAAANLTVSGGTPPTITGQPTPQLGCPGGSVGFTVAAVGGGGSPLYRWRRNGVPLNPQPGHIMGVFSPNLLIQNVSAADAGAYDCVVTVGCGSTTSASAALTFCYANCDCSGSTPLLTPNDFACFLNAYANGLTTANCDGSSGTPLLTPNDFACYVNAYANGCP